MKRFRNGHVTVTVTPPDTDTDTDTEKEREKKVVSDRTSTLDFLSHLKEIYTWIDVETELSKMKGWLSTRKGRRLTQRFAVNWLNKIDKPIKGEIKSW